MFLLQLVCERADLLATACGVARAYPTYSRKTASAAPQDYNITVEVILVGKGDAPLNDEDIKVVKIFSDFYLELILQYYH